MKKIRPIMVSLKEQELTQESKKILKELNPLGVILFKRNIADKTQLRKLTDDIKECIDFDNVLIGIDQEGGHTCRLTPPDYPAYLSQEAIGSLPLKKAKEMAYLHATLIALDLYEVGVNWNYSPVLDLPRNDTSSVLNGRCFSRDPDTIITLGKTTIDTYHNNGIIACMKHIPGHGAAQVDSHRQLPIITKTQNELQNDFKTFKALSKTVHTAMTAHVVLPFIDPENPITLSKEGIKFIRQEIGFDGIIISDAVEMRALQGDMSQRAVKALEAGCDIAAYCAGDPEVLKDMIDKIPFISDESMSRLQSIFPILSHIPSENNKEELFSKYNELSKDINIEDKGYDAVETLNQPN